MALKDCNGISVVHEGDVISRCRCVYEPGLYMVFPRENRVEHKLPPFEGASAQVLAAPPIGAGFVEHELLIHPHGGTPRPIEEHLEQFIYTLHGKVELTIGSTVHKLCRVASVGCLRGKRID